RTSTPKAFITNVLTQSSDGRLMGIPPAFAPCRFASSKGSQIESVPSGMAYPTKAANEGIYPMSELALKRAVLPGAATREKLRTLDDAGVVAAFLGGEERAFQELVERYQTRLLNFIYRTIGDREKAEDLVQEVFIRGYRDIHTFYRTKKFATWVYTIASNLAKNELRNRSRNPLVLFQTI